MSTAAAPDSAQAPAGPPATPRGADDIGRRRQTAEYWVLAVLKWGSIAFFVAITAFPLLYMVSLSFKDISEVLRNPGDFFPAIDEIASFATYRDILRPAEQGGRGFLVYLRNSGAVALSAVIVTVGLGTLAAYAAARLNFFGKRAINLGMVLVYLFPAIVMAIPLFVLFSAIGLRDSLVGLIIVYLAQTIPVALYMLRSYFITVPVEIEESALIDGCSRLSVIRRIVLPLAAPALAAVALYVFMIAWNEFLYALLFLTQSPDLWTLPLGLQQLDNQEIPRTVLMSGAVIISLPVIVIFFVAERFLTEGLTAGAVKG
jgi:multiple sugar transport system permease protein